MTDAEPAAAELYRLVETHGLAFARAYATPAEMLAGIKRGEHTVGRSRAMLLQPAMEFLSGDPDAARSSLRAGIEHFGDNLQIPIVPQFHRYAADLTRRIDNLPQ